MKNGFTLIELLGVIVIISVLALITVPIIDSSLNKGKDNISKVQEKQLIKALRDYYASNSKDLSSMEDGTICKTVKELQNTGFLPEKIVDPKTNHEYTDDELSVCITKETIQECEDDMFSNCIKYDYEIRYNP